MYYDGKSVGKAFKMKRVMELNATLEDVAVKLKVSKATLSRIERGNKPDVETFAKVCKWMGVTMESCFIKRK